MKSSADVKVDAAGNAILPLGANLSGQEVHIAFDIERSQSDTYDDPDIIPAAAPVEGEAYQTLLTQLYGCWDGNLFEPLDPPLDELGPLFDDADEEGPTSLSGTNGTP